MLYYNIHSHHANVEPNVAVIYNLSPGNICSALNLNQKNLYYSIGIHPWDIGKSFADIKTLENNILQVKDKTVAIGEIGLDKLIDVSMDKQICIFEKQIELALSLELPIIIHCVKAWDVLLDIHKKYRPKKSWIIHGFRGKKEQAEQLVKQGFMLSLGKYYNQETLKSIFPSSLFLETDDDVDLNIIDLYQSVSLDLDCEIIDLQEEIKQNVIRVFDL